MRISTSHLLFCIIAITALSACHVGAPTPMPRGYSSFDKELKSVAGQDARDVGYAYSNQKNNSVLQDMQYAASDLADKLDARLSFSSDEIHLSSPANTSFYNGFDHLLRHELTQRGYLLARTESADTISVDFVARDDAQTCLADDHAGPYKNMYLALAVNVDRKNIPEYVVGDFYEVPTYDFIPAGNVKTPVPSCASTEGHNHG